MNAKEIISDVTEKIQKHTNVKAVFGDPIEKGELTVIPVARVSICGAGGGGSGELATEKSKGGGLGLGIHTRATPVGYIEIHPEGARYVEITEQKRLTLAVVGLGAFAVFSFTRLLMKLLKRK